MPLVESEVLYWGFKKNVTLHTSIKVYSSKCDNIRIQAEHI